MDLELNKRKTEVIDLNQENFDYLGYNLMKNGEIWIRKKTRKKILEGIYEKYKYKDGLKFEEFLSGYKGFTTPSKSRLNLLV